jgi:TolA-binding protein
MDRSPWPKLLRYRLWSDDKGLQGMQNKVSSMRLRIKELEGRIQAQRQVAEQAPERTWHLDYVEAYEAEMRQLQAILQEKAAALQAGPRSQD